jgi:arylsulfatase A-like enzyme
MIVNGYHRKRSGQIQWISEPGWYSGDHGATGTTHGSWNPYDTHIPLLWYGWGIAKGETHRTVHMTDIAPTLAALLHIQMPSGNIGKVITPVLR